MKGKRFGSIDEMDLAIIDEIAMLAEDLLAKRGMRGDSEEEPAMMKVEMEAVGGEALEEGMEDEEGSMMGESGPVMDSDVDQAIEEAQMDEMADDDEDDEFALRRKRKIY